MISGASANISAMATRAFWVSLIPFVAANDNAAFEHARQFVNGYDVELWSGGRFVAKLEPTK
jgi:hypothetical protein